MSHGEPVAEMSWPYVSESQSKKSILLTMFPILLREASVC